MTGKVVDEQTGRPVGAFRVKLGSPTEPGPKDEQDEPDEEILGHFSEVGAEVRSPDGTFAVPDRASRGVFSVLVSAEGYAPSRVGRVAAQAAGATKPPALIRLGKGDRIAGSVLDAETGRGGAAAEVLLLVSLRPFPKLFEATCIQGPPGERGVEWMERAATGPDGGFEFPHAPAWGHPALVVRSAGYAFTVVRDPSPAKPVVIRFARGATIEGTAKDFPGMDRRRAYVDAGSEGLWLGRTRLRRGGSFRLEGLTEGAWTLRLMMDDRDQRQAATVSLAVGQTMRLDLANPPGFRVNGRVTRGGAPCPGIDIRVSCTDLDWTADRPTDAEGRYSVPGFPPGAVKVEARDNRRGIPERESVPLVSQTACVVDRDITVDFTFLAGRIEGHLLEGGIDFTPLRLEGQDAPPDRVLGLWRDEKSSGFWDSRIDQEDRRLLGLRATRLIASARYTRCGDRGTVDAEGRFAIDRLLPPGDYALWIAPSDTSLASLPSLAAGGRVERGGAAARFNLRLDRDAAFRVKLVDSETRAPLAGARIVVCTAAGFLLAGSRHDDCIYLRRPLDQAFDRGTGVFKTDREGVFSLDTLERVDYGLWVVAPGYGTRFVAPVAARAQKPPPETTFALERAGTLVLRAAPALLKGLPNPYLAYRIRDAAGRAVCPGGECSWGVPPFETGVAKLFEASPPECRTEIAPPGRYTLEWEIYQRAVQGPDERGHFLPAAHHGKAEIEIRKAGETVVPLVP